MLVLSMMNVSCLLDGEAEEVINGSDGGSSSSNSAIVGTWVFNDSGSGYSDVRTYTFKNNGEGHCKEVWTNTGRSDLADSYTDEYDFSYTVVETTGIIMIDGYDHKFSISCSTLTLDGQKYTKQ